MHIVSNDTELVKVACSQTSDSSGQSSREAAISALNILV